MGWGLKIIRVVKIKFYISLKFGFYEQPIEVPQFKHL